MEHEDELNEDEGMSTPKKVATGAAVGLATAAAVGVGKKLIGSNGADEGDGQTGRGQKSRSGASPSRARSGRTTRSAGSRGQTARSKRSRSTSGSSSSRGGEKTKEQLYAQAKRLKIEGRSRMTKAQLQRAVQRARS
jgi:hypothetical protein